VTEKQLERFEELVERFEDLVVRLQETALRVGERFPDNEEVSEALDLFLDDLLGGGIED
jgi:hypothetical protein